MENKSSSGGSGGGIGFCGVLTIVFIALKLTGFIKWSWLWVLSPLWISEILYILLGIVIIKIFK